MEEKKENKIQIILFWIISAIFLFATLLSAIRIRYGNTAQFITYGLATICMNPVFLNYINKKTKINIKWYIQIIVTIIIITLGSLFFGDSITEETIKNEVLTASNYEEIMDKWEKELKGKKTDDIYYFTYSNMHYMIQNGITSVFLDSNNDSMMYLNIYGKTVQQLIDEGKQLMKDDNITIEEFKKEVENMSNTII